MIILAVDLGKARTGLAICDKDERMAFPKEVITEYHAQRLAQTVAEKAKAYGAELIVIGLPKNMDGSLGFRAEECTAAAHSIEEISGLPVTMWDERCTTVIAHQMLNTTDTRGKKRKQVVDAVSAVILLEDYLSWRRNHKHENEPQKELQN